MTLGIIPARAGSKGIKNKNLSLLDGKPLLYYTIRAAKSAKCIDKIVLNSDGDEILEYGKKEGIEVLKRPHNLALDNSKSQDVVSHTLEYFRDFDTIILLQPTSPLRTHIHIDEAFEIYKNARAEALISVCECDNKILKVFMLDSDGYLRGICNDSYPFAPRQSLPSTFMGNGAIYIIDTKRFLDNQSFLQSKTSYYLMDTKSSIDIDCKEDLIEATRLLNKSPH